MDINLKLCPQFKAGLGTLSIEKRFVLCIGRHADSAALAIAFTSAINHINFMAGICANGLGRSDGYERPSGLVGSFLSS